MALEITFPSIGFSTNCFLTRTGVTVNAMTIFKQSVTKCNKDIAAGTIAAI